jgi:hypothetical protein
LGGAAPSRGVFLICSVDSLCSAQPSGGPVLGVFSVQPCTVCGVGLFQNAIICPQTEDLTTLDPDSSDGECTFRGVDGGL